jgi:hypothetical protein
MYLNQPDGGGGTIFRRLNLEIKPKRGSAVIFFPGFLNGQLNLDVLHAGLPPIGTKWVSQVWIRQSYREDGQPSKPVRHTTRNRPVDGREIGGRQASAEPGKRYRCCAPTRFRDQS